MGDSKSSLNVESDVSPEVQESQKYLKFLAIMSWVGTVFFAGTIYGFASLQLMLENEGALHSQCVSEEQFKKGEACADQLKDFSLIFSIGSSLQTFSSFFVGYTIDVYGPRYCLLAAGFFMCSGILLFASAELDSVSQYVTAISFTAVGANIVYLSSFTVSFVVDSSFMSTYNTVNSCLFDTSSVMYFIFYMMTLHLDLTFKDIFVGYFFFAILIFSGLCYAWYLVEPILQDKKMKLELAHEHHVKNISRSPTPTSSPIMGTYTGGSSSGSGGKGSSSGQGGYESIAGSSSHAHDDVSSGGDKKPRSMSLTDQQKMEGGAAGDAAASGMARTRSRREGILVGDELVSQVEDMHSIPWYNQLRSPQFVAITFYAGLHLLRACSYMGNMENYLNSLGDKETGHMYTSIFSVVVPLGFLVIPLVDYIMFSNTFVSSLHIVTYLGVAFGIVTCVTSLNVQVVGFFIFCVFRALLYSVIGTFVAHTFGPLNGGRTNGVLWLLASILNFTLYPLSSFVLENCGGDWTLLNVLLLLCCIPAYSVIQHGLLPTVSAVAGADRPTKE